MAKGNGNFRYMAKSIGTDHVVISSYITFVDRCIGNGPMEGFFGILKCEMFKERILKLL